MILVKVFRLLNKQKIRYLVAGGVASVLYGNPRFTKDLDLFVDSKEKNLRMLIHAFKRLKFIPRVPVRAEEMAFQKTEGAGYVKKECSPSHLLIQKIH